MGKAQLAFEGVLWGGATESDVTGSDISQVPCSEVCSVHAEPEAVPYRPSRAFWPEVTSVTWPEEAMSGSGPDRKQVLRMTGFSRAFFLVVVSWLPDVT